MSWLYGSWSVPSAKNGRITVDRAFEFWEVNVDGTGQTTTYTNAMWRDALQKIPATFPVHRVLVLGLAGAGMIKQIMRRFPSCVIECIEWDQAMVDVFDRMQAYRPYPRPAILMGDAYELVPTLTRTYDLIVLDLFTGSASAHDPSRTAFYESLLARLSTHGMLLANAFQETGMFDALARVAVCTLRWTYQFNELAIFQPLSIARIGDPLPSGYRPFRTVRAYLEREAAAHFGWSVVGAEESLGLRWHVGPFWYDDFWGDTEPTIAPNGPRRRITWQRILQNGEPPLGWYERSEKKLTGFVNVTDGVQYERWSSHARRHLEKWNAQHEWEIVDVSFDALIEAYRKTSLDFLLKQFFLKLLRDKHRAHGERVRCVGVRRRGSDKLVAGFVTLDIPEASQTIHLISFLLPEAKPISAGVGLIDHWLTAAQQRGIRFCDFDIFWTPGNPASWEGFSRFKSQFGTQFIRYPAALLRRRAP